MGLQHRVYHRQGAKVETEANIENLMLDAIFRDRVAYCLGSQTLAPGRDPERSPVDRQSALPLPPERHAWSKCPMWCFGGPLQVLCQSALHDDLPRYLPAR